MPHGPPKTFAQGEVPSVEGVVFMTPNDRSAELKVECTNKNSGVVKVNLSVKYRLPDGSFDTPRYIRRFVKLSPQDTMIVSDIYLNNSEQLLMLADTGNAVDYIISGYEGDVV